MTWMQSFMGRKKTWSQRVDERTRELFYERNKCAHMSTEHPCGPNGAGKQAWCEEAYAVYRQARMEAMDEVKA